MNRAIVPELPFYGVSESRGFVPDEDPPLSLPPYFSPWDSLVSSIPALLQTSSQASLRERVIALPLLDHTRLQEPRHIRRAHLLLMTIAHSYVWCSGDSGVRKLLPRNVAIPWVGVSDRLGLPPIITHCDVVLNNWTKIDPEGPLELDNLRTLVSISGCGRDEEWFWLVTTQVELCAAPGISSVIKAQKAILANNSDTLAESLSIMELSILAMVNTLPRMYEHCDRHVFFNQMRPFIAGWKHSKVLPDGLIYEGVWDEPQQFAGSSAGQSSAVACFDEALGINYEPEDGNLQQKLNWEFIADLRNYMPREHRDFLTAVRDGPSIREYVKNSGDAKLKQLYNACVNASVKFRSDHIKLASSYIIIQAAKSQNNDHKSLYGQGTGGTGIMPVLKFIRNRIQQHLL
jgi:indoleamine 2,3-dioxygenase